MSYDQGFQLFLNCAELWGIARSLLGSILLIKSGISRRDLRQRDVFQSRQKLMFILNLDPEIGMDQRTVLSSHLTLRKLLNPKQASNQILDPKWNLNLDPILGLKLILNVDSILHLKLKVNQSQVQISFFRRETRLQPCILRR